MEQELDKLCDEEVEKMWQKRLAQWRREKEARRQLLQEVLAARSLQVHNRCMLLKNLWGQIFRGVACLG